MIPVYEAYYEGSFDLKAARIITPRQSLEVKEIERPEPKGSQVLIRVQSAGVCHSDIHLWDGRFGRELSRSGMLEFVNIKSVRFYNQLIYNHHVE